MILFDKDIMPPKGSPIYVGFSGGADSLAAAHFLKGGGWDVRLLHVKHFNTAASIKIAAGVAVAAQHLGLGATLFRGPESRFLRPTEATAYDIRHAIISGTPYPVILCNHLNDLAEGYFMNCMQGFPERVPLLARNGNKYRPFLRTKKKDFMGYLERNGLTHLIVPDDMLSLRGKLRDTVFPTLQDDWTSAAKKLFVDTGRIYEGQPQQRTDCE